MKRIFWGIVYTSSALIFSFPILYTIFYSFKNTDGIVSGYNELFFNCFSFYPAFWNSVLYTLAIVILQLIIIIPTAFAFTKIRSKAVNFAFILYIILMMMPLQVTLLPVYIGLRDFHLLDTRLGIILPITFSPMYVVIMKQYMTTINFSIIEAITLETNSLARIIFSGIIPQIKPCIYAVILLSAAETWNIYEEPVYFLKKADLMPMSVFINKISVYENSMIFCASVICIVPMVLLYGLFSDYLKKGIALSNEIEKNHFCGVYFVFCRYDFLNRSFKTYTRSRFMSCRNN